MRVVAVGRTRPRRADAVQDQQRHEQQSRPSDLGENRSTWGEGTLSGAAQRRHHPRARRQAHHEGGPSRWRTAPRCGHAERATSVVVSPPSPSAGPFAATDHRALAPCQHGASVNTVHAARMPRVTATEPSAVASAKATGYDAARQDQCAGRSSSRLPHEEKRGRGQGSEHDAHHSSCGRIARRVMPGIAARML